MANPNDINPLDLVVVSSDHTSPILDGQTASSAFMKGLVTPVVSPIPNISNLVNRQSSRTELPAVKKQQSPRPHLVETKQLSLKNKPSDKVGAVLVFFYASVIFVSSLP